MGEESKALDAIAIENLRAGYDRREVLEDVSFAIPKGCMVSVIGPNGSGKSTLLRIILGLLEPWSGDVRILGRTPNEMRSHIGYTPQAEHVDWQFPLTVAEVVMMGRYAGLGLLRRPGPADRAAVTRALEHVDLADLAGRQIGELSGGQQRRMLVARAIVSDPDILLLDEPMAGLDAVSQHDLLDLLERLRDEDGKTILMSTHDLTCVVGCFDRALLLNKRVIAYGPADSVFTEELLNEVYGSHLVLLPIEGRLYAVHHGHD